MKVGKDYYYFPTQNTFCLRLSYTHYLSSGLGRLKNVSSLVEELAVLPGSEGFILKGRILLKLSYINPQGEEKIKKEERNFSIFLPEMASPLNCLLFPHLELDYLQVEALNQQGEIIKIKSYLSLMVRCLLGKRLGSWLGKQLFLVDSILEERREELVFTLSIPSSAEWQQVVELKASILKLEITPLQQVLLLTGSIELTLYYLDQGSVLFLDCLLKPLDRLLERRDTGGAVRINCQGELKDLIWEKRKNRLEVSLQLALQLEVLQRTEVESDVFEGSKESGRSPLRKLSLRSVLKKGEEELLILRRVIPPADYFQLVSVETALRLEETRAVDRALFLQGRVEFFLFYINQRGIECRKTYSFLWQEWLEVETQSHEVEVETLVGEVNCEYREEQILFFLPLQLNYYLLERGIFELLCANDEVSLSHPLRAARSLGQISRIFNNRTEYRLDQKAHLIQGVEAELSGEVSPLQPGRLLLTGRMDFHLYYLPLREEEEHYLKFQRQIRLELEADKLETGFSAEPSFHLLDINYILREESLVEVVSSWLVNLELLDKIDNHYLLTGSSCQKPLFSLALEGEENKSCQESIVLKGLQEIMNLELELISMNRLDEGVFCLGCRYMISWQDKRGVIQLTEHKAEEYIKLEEVPASSNNTFSWEGRVRELAWAREGEGVFLYSCLFIAYRFWEPL